MLKQRISGKWQEQLRFYSVKSSLGKWHLNGDLKEEGKGTQWGGKQRKLDFSQRQRKILDVWKTARVVLWSLESKRHVK